MKILIVEEWMSKAQAHLDRVKIHAEDYVARQRAGIKHPVLDFLFTYYTSSPQKLMQWIPAFDQSLVVDDNFRGAFPWLNEYWFTLKNNVLSLNPERLPPHVKGLTQFIKDLCFNIGSRSPKFGCFGLHEWAMVYKLSDDEIRHREVKLRLSMEELAGFVESQTIRCTHYDAYRFFTKEAKPLNVLNPVLGNRLQMEQGGCLHANMDIYKWSVKLWPWIGSDFMGRAFELALMGRELDMRASPYDLADLGYKAIKIETEAGRKEYQREQQLYYEAAQPLREELRLFCEKFLVWLD